MTTPLKQVRHCCCTPQNSSYIHVAGLVVAHLLLRTSSMIQYSRRRVHPSQARRTWTCGGCHLQPVTTVCCSGNIMQRGNQYGAAANKKTRIPCHMDTLLGAGGLCGHPSVCVPAPLQGSTQRRVSIDKKPRAGMAAYLLCPAGRYTGQAT